MTGTSNPGDLPPAVARLWEAAKRGDLATMQAHIDFVVGGVALIVNALWDLDAEERDSAAQAGLFELESVGARPDLARPALEKLATVLRRATGVGPADEAQTESARSALRVARLPEKLAPETRQRLAELAARAGDIDNVYQVTVPDEEWLLAVTADGERVAPIRLGRDAAKLAEPLRW